MATTLRSMLLDLWLPAKHAHSLQCSARQRYIDAKYLVHHTHFANHACALLLQCQTASMLFDFVIAIQTALCGSVKIQYLLIWPILGHKRKHACT